MNETKNENGNSEIPTVEDLVIEDGDDAETIKTKTEAYKSKLDENNKQLFARAKKAEGFTLIDGKWIKTATPEKKEEKPEATTETKGSKDGITQTDLYALIKAEVPEEDIDEVVEYATLKKIPVAEALKSQIVKTILADKAEQRKVAEGTDTGGGKRGNAKISDDQLVQNANKGIMPESDEDIKRLVAIRLKSK